MKRLALLVLLLPALLPLPAHAQSSPRKFDSAASTNSTLVATGYAEVRFILVTNTTTTLYYLKLYDKVTAPTCNSDTVVLKAAVPFGASNSGGGFVVPIPDGLRFQNGLGFCLTGAIGDTDNSNAATGVTINFGVKQ